MRCPVIGANNYACSRLANPPASCPEALTQEWTDAPYRYSKYTQAAVA